MGVNLRLSMFWLDRREGEGSVESLHGKYNHETIIKLLEKTHLKNASKKGAWTSSHSFYLERINVSNIRSNEQNRSLSSPLGNKILMALLCTLTRSCQAEMFSGLGLKKQTLLSLSAVLLAVCTTAAEESGSRTHNVPT